MKINPQRVFKFYADPGHAWLAVPIDYLVKTLTNEELGRISAYSYIKGKTAYLEEDCDAALFIEAWKKGGTGFRYESKHTDKRSAIRSYERWKDF
jgi:hypothetical protein